MVFTYGNRNCKSIIDHCTSCITALLCCSWYFKYHLLPNIINFIAICQFSFFNSETNKSSSHEYSLETYSMRLTKSFSIFSRLLFENQSAAIFFGMRKSIGHKYDVDWDAFVHAIISGFGSAICIYLNSNAALSMNGITEPLGSIQCNGSLTSLHRIIPAVTQGYAVCDIINGFRLGPAFLAHGIATFTVMHLFNENNASHIITPMLVMEISTIVLAVLRANFFTPTMQLLTQASFALLFFISRIIISPAVHFEIAKLMFLNKDEMVNCIPILIFYMTLLFGAFFHGLNLFCKWFLMLYSCDVNSN